MYQIAITAAQVNKASPTGFFNVATLTTEGVYPDRLIAEAILEHAATTDADIVRLRMLLQHTYPGALIAVGVRSVVTDIIPRTL
jgi:hypothetical protein